MNDPMVLTLTVVAVLIVVLGVLRLRHVSLQNLALGLIGAIFGLLLGALASVPLSKLPEPFGSILPLVVAVFFVIVMMGVIYSRSGALLAMLPILRVEKKESSRAPDSPAPAPGLPKILVDTSVIIDGRIADVCETGFLEGKLVVPRFVLREIQQIADSPDALRRNRGKRGFEILQRLQRLPRVTLEVEDREFPQVRAVDEKLLELARAVSGTVVTNDYNLNKMAEVSGVSVLNVNDLANALKPALLPGETLRLHVLREGKEAGQGIAYLDDGTMVVVDHGKRLIGQTVDASVTSVLQTSAGRMVFARPASAPSVGPALGEGTQ
jgi:uncharacterized protein YacL